MRISVPKEVMNNENLVACRYERSKMACSMGFLWYKFPVKTR